MRWLGGLTGVAAIVAGAYLGVESSTGSVASVVGEDTRSPAGVVGATCASVGVALSADQIPAEGIAENSVVRLTRVDESGQAELLAAQAYVLRVVQVEADSIQLSVLVRSDGVGGDLVEAVTGANADRTLAAAVLYDVDPLTVLDECRGAG
jgi:hypothetical protein